MKRTTYSFNGLAQQTRISGKPLNCKGRVQEPAPATGDCATGEPKIITTLKREINQ